MERIHTGAVALMAFMLAVFSVTMSEYLPVREATYSWGIVSLLLLFSFIILGSGVLALSTHFALSQDGERIPAYASYGYCAVIALAAVAPVLMFAVL